MAEIVAEAGLFDGVAVSVEDNLPPEVAPLAAARGRNPDRPAHLLKVTETV